MPKGEPQVRLYGSARSDDPKYTMYICLECAEKSGDTKTKKALEVVEHKMEERMEGK